MQKRMVVLGTLVLLFFGLCLGARAEKKDKLVFGAIAVGKVSQVRQSLDPLLRHLEEATGADIEFQTGKDYMDTIEKFRSGYFDFGYIGPSPYVIATSGEEGTEAFKLVAGLETKGKPY